MKLKSLIVDTKSAWFNYPEIPEFKVKIAALSRKSIAKLYDDNTEVKNEYNPATKTYEETKELNVEKYVDSWCKAVVLGWEGLKLGHLELLGLFDIGDEDPDSLLPYSHDDAVALISNSVSFDKWVSDVTGNLANFRSRPKKPDVGETVEVDERVEVENNQGSLL